ncbi:DpnII family type II restriction endonuclease [Halorubrum sp. Ea8]|uniref:DpnII family type II restriction endonuclease n=1 Tax=Halorubrum sp. Ea8 TaxID=1383841 RepID=UPI000B99657B|nr:DpnII family type II restriction endonuclease [Halorubrum sp. Ea8]OYR45135.1 hypothetical protein DJ74_16700 [Halorubrum sp. Ea8]
MPIRQHRPFVDKFAEEFQRSLLSSPVPLTDVISWNKIESAVESKADVLPIMEDESSPQEFILQEFVRHEQAENRCNILFDLLYFRNSRLQSKDVTWDLTKTRISNLESESSEQFARDLTEVGAHRLFRSREKLSGHLEQFELFNNQQHRNNQQNPQYFERLIAESLQDISADLSSTANLAAEESVITNSNTEENIFDYVLYDDSEPQIVFEVKYIDSFSQKIHELIQSFDRLSTKLRNAGIEFVWIVDGEGWKESPESIEKAYKRIIDVYNSEQVTTSLEADIRNFLENGPAVSEDEVKLDQDTNLEDFN